MSEATTLSEKNREYWDSNSNAYDAKPWIKVGVRMIADAVRSNLQWIGVEWVSKDGEGQNEKEVRMLDYACGPGNIANTLWPYVSQVHGVDVSGGMVEEFNRRAEAQGINAKQMFATQGDFLADLTPESAIAGPEFFNLDLLTCSMAFHHLDNPDLAAKRMVKHLKPGSGVVLIIDWTPDGDTKHKHGLESSHSHNPSQEPVSPHGQFKPHAAEHTIAHHGFSKERMEKILQDAGCVDIDYIVLEEPFKFGDEFNGMEKKCFFARGKRAA
ncbi:hypothetical protein MMC30_008321 [Trapelia coarctata]|nr:hypothetical protein [Trapelia coarctata]